MVRITRDAMREGLGHLPRSFLSSQANLAGIKPHCMVVQALLDPQAFAPAPHLLVDITADTPMRPHEWSAPLSRSDVGSAPLCLIRSSRIGRGHARSTVMSLAQERSAVRGWMCSSRNQCMCFVQCESH